MSHNYRFERGDLVRIRGHHAGGAGVVDNAVFQKTVDYPEEYAASYHVLLEDERVVAVRWDQAAKR